MLGINPDSEGQPQRRKDNGTMRLWDSGTVGHTTGHHNGDDMLWHVVLTLTLATPGARLLAWPRSKRGKSFPRCLPVALGRERERQREVVNEELTPRPDESVSHPFLPLPSLSTGNSKRISYLNLNSNTHPLALRLLLFLCTGRMGDKWVSRGV